MGERTVAQEALFYSFSLERHVPADHMLRSIGALVAPLGSLRPRADERAVAGKKDGKHQRHLLGDASRLHADHLDEGGAEPEAAAISGVPERRLFCCARKARHAPRENSRARWFRTTPTGYRSSAFASGKWSWWRRNNHLCPGRCMRIDGRSRVNQIQSDENMRHHHRNSLGTGRQPAISEP